MVQTVSEQVLREVTGESLVDPKFKRGETSLHIQRASGSNKTNKRSEEKKFSMHLPVYAHFVVCPFKLIVMTTLPHLCDCQPPVFFFGMLKEFQF